MGKCSFTSEPHGAPAVARVAMSRSAGCRAGANAARLTAAAEPNRSGLLVRETAQSVRDPCQRLAEGQARKGRAGHDGSAVWSRMCPEARGTLRTRKTRHARSGPEDARATAARNRPNVLAFAALPRRQALRGYCVSAGRSGQPAQAFGRPERWPSPKTVSEPVAWFEHCAVAGGAFRSPAPRRRHAPSPLERLAFFEGRPRRRGRSARKRS